MKILSKMQSSFFLIGGMLAALLGSAVIAPGQASAPDATTAAPPMVITLDEAIHRAQSSDANYAAAVPRAGQQPWTVTLRTPICCRTLCITTKVSTRSRMERRTRLAQGVSSQPAPRFIANNAVREYASQ